MALEMPCPRLPATTIHEALQALIAMLIPVNNLLIYVYQRRFSGFVKLPVAYLYESSG